jgi:hypothetical protein
MLAIFSFSATILPYRFLITKEETNKCPVQQLKRQKHCIVVSLYSVIDSEKKAYFWFLPHFPKKEVEIM